MAQLVVESDAQGDRAAKVEIALRRGSGVAHDDVMTAGTARDDAGAAGVDLQLRDRVTASAPDTRGDRECHVETEQLGEWAGNGVSVDVHVNLPWVRSVRCEYASPRNRHRATGQ